MPARGHSVQQKECAIEFLKILYVGQNRIGVSVSAGIVVPPSRATAPAQRQKGNGFLVVSARSLQALVRPRALNALSMNVPSCS